MTIWFMTTNQGKVEEARQYFAGYGIEVKQFEFEATEPQADDLEIVALSKIEQAIPHLPNSNDMLFIERSKPLANRMSMNGMISATSSCVRTGLDW